MSLFKADKENPFSGPHQGQRIAERNDPSDAKAAFIMVHGRGASAPSILTLADEIEPESIYYTAPQASGSTWYPYSFLQPTERNEPGISSGLQAIYDIREMLKEKGFSSEQIFILGFSQGACLASEFVARHPGRYAGLIVLSGGLIGDSVNPSVYSGDLEGTPVFMGCSDIDPHIPVERVHATAEVFSKLNAKVSKKIYPGMGHLVNHDEIKHIQEIVSGVVNK
ncbi:alpha/beta hydrolase [Balneola sp. MJW-20]|uniref:alpha/beta hydrolase n=1 Tax=Gracilimonas aurantiaca TaxID=3234185 RepID=UPI003467DBFC